MNGVLEPPTPPTPGPGALPSSLKADIVDIVSDVLQWRLTEARWKQVEQLVNALHEALQTASLEAVEKATADLELASPLRIIPIGTPPLEPPESQLRGIVVRIVHDLGEGSRPSLKDGQVDDRQDNDPGTGHGAASC
jgi:hypothetical protein